MRIKTRAAGALCSALALVSLSAGSGCGDLQCAAAPPPPGALLTLHLPPEAAATAPETVRVCRQPTCTDAVLPLVGPAGTLTGVTFSLPEVTGRLQRNAGDVRLLTIEWVVKDIKTSDPSNHFDVEVKDSADRVIGVLSNSVRYTPVEVCGSSSLRAELSD